MPYTPTTWVNGSAPAVSAANLNNIENGIVAAIRADGSVAMTASLNVVTGSASTPSISSSTDTNTGIYFAGADKLAISEGGISLTFDELKMMIGMGAML